MKDERPEAVVCAFILHPSAFILSHTSRNCGVSLASKNALISLAGFFEISSLGDTSYQSVGKNCVYGCCVKRRQRRAMMPMSVSLRITRPADCTTRVIPGIR